VIGPQSRPPQRPEAPAKNRDLSGSLPTVLRSSIQGRTGLIEARNQAQRPEEGAIAPAPPSPFKPIRGIVRVTDSLRDVARNT
jgi:hypothetical protein